jgi:hypothetical protein
MFIEPKLGDLKNDGFSTLSYYLYKNLSRSAFILRKNFRAKDDPTLTELCDALQSGEITQKHKDLLNARILTVESGDEFRKLLVEPDISGQSVNIAIATSLNSHRNYTNQQYANLTASYLQQTGRSQIVLCPAEIWSKKFDVNDKLRSYINSVIPMIGKQAPLLPLWEGK